MRDYPLPSKPLFMLGGRNSGRTTLGLLAAYGYYMDGRNVLYIHDESHSAFTEKLKRLPGILDDGDEIERGTIQVIRWIGISDLDRSLRNWDRSPPADIVFVDTVLDWDYLNAINKSLNKTWPKIRMIVVAQINRGDTFLGRNGIEMDYE